MPRNFANLILIIILVAGISISGTYFYLTEINGKILSSQEAAQKAVDYINKNLLQKGITASLGDTTEENGLYKFHMKIGEKDFISYVTKNGKILFPEEGIDLEKKLTKEETPSEKTQSQEEEKSTTLGSFKISKDEICKEDGKPIVYFFGSQSCPHCKWEHPIVEAVASKFSDYISFHNNMDVDADKDIFSKYSTGGIPTLVLGCKYFRVGSGESIGKEEEKKALISLICDLTENQPTEVCQ